MLETCGACGTRFAVGLVACPHCQEPLGVPPEPAPEVSDDEEVQVDA